jgi:hypothetical protein
MNLKKLLLFIGIIGVVYLLIKMRKSIIMFIIIAAVYIIFLLVMVYKVQSEKK